MVDFLNHLDTALFLFFNRDLACPVLDPFFTTITNGRFWIIPGLLMATAFVLKERKAALWALIMAAITVALSDQITCAIIKPLVHRLRPCNPSVMIEGGRFLLGLKTSLSFPSAHAANWFAQAMLFTLLYPRRGFWFFLCAAAVAYSRIYVGVHYPIDVLGGAVLGVVIGAAVFFAWRTVAKRLRGNRQECVPRN
jgi:undecaprenyl-diphosphatase